jgi:hypothetical protein
VCCRAEEYPFLILQRPDSISRRDARKWRGSTRPFGGPSGHRLVTNHLAQNYLHEPGEKALSHPSSRAEEIDLLRGVGEKPIIWNCCLPVSLISRYVAETAIETGEVEI